MIPGRRILTVGFTALLFLGTLRPCEAQNMPVDAAPESGSLESSPPARVGQVSLVQGAASWRGVGENAWIVAGPNVPVTGDNAFRTEPDARLEIRIGADALRLDGGTELDVQQLDEQTLQVNVPLGTVNLHIDDKRRDETYRVVTPRGAVTLDAPGDFRIEAGTGVQPTVVAVLSGSARFVADTSVTLVAGETVAVFGFLPVSYTMESTRPTAFDDWCLARDQAFAASGGTNYVSPEMTGYQDLGAYGTWQTLPEYGPVWSPATVPAGWEPYRFGHWAWIAPWGWTWIDDEPWGFAPFHYGRWFVHNKRWCWWPGTRRYRPVYAPALVVFVGNPGTASVEWFPLAPHEPYHPSYHASDRYFRDINANYLRHKLDVHEKPALYANRSYATVAPETAFTARRDVNSAPLNRPRDTTDRAPVTFAAPPPQERKVTGRGETPIGSPTVQSPRFQGRPGKRLPSQTTQHAVESGAREPFPAPVPPNDGPTPSLAPQVLQRLPQQPRLERERGFVPTPQQTAPSREIVVPQRHREEPAYVLPREITVPKPTPRAQLSRGHEGWQKAQRPSTAAEHAPQSGRAERRAPASADPRRDNNDHRGGGHDKRERLDESH